MSAFVPYRRLCLLGLGLIGGSIGHAAKRHGLAAEIVGFAKTEATREKALALGFIDRAEASAAAAAEGADLVIFCSPVGTYGPLAAEIGPRLAPGALISDVGSVKARVVRDVLAHLPDGVDFLPAHPIAGTEYSGPEAGFAELFENRWTIVTPVDRAAPEVIDRYTAFWKAMGANVDTMTPEHHDLVLAITSHVPHLIAYTIVCSAADLETVTRSEVTKYSAGGFRDFTRIASSDPTMWRDIFLSNREAVLEMLGRFVEDLTVLQRAVREGDGDTLFAKFTAGRDIRRRIIAAGQETALPDFGRRQK